MLCRYLIEVIYLLLYLIWSCQSQPPFRKALNARSSMVNALPVSHFPGEGISLWHASTSSSSTPDLCPPFQLQLLLSLLAVLVPPPSCTRQRTGSFIGTLVSYSIPAGISRTTLGRWKFVLAALIASYPTLQALGRFTLH
jgi:hypothetical protein